MTVTANSLNSSIFFIIFEKSRILNIKLQIWSCKKRLAFSAQSIFSEHVILSSMRWLCMKYNIFCDDNSIKNYQHKKSFSAQKNEWHDWKLKEYWIAKLKYTQIWLKQIFDWEKESNNKENICSEISSLVLFSLVRMRETKEIVKKLSEIMFMKRMKLTL